MTKYEALAAALRQEFRLLPDEGVIGFIHLLGERVRLLEDALESDVFTCPDCGGPVRATVLDEVQGAVWVSQSCCLEAGDRITAAALERYRLGRVFGGPGAATAEAETGEPRCSN